MKNIWDRLETYQINNQGKVELPLVNSENGKKKIFDDMDIYLKWKEDTINSLKDQIKSKLNLKINADFRQEIMNI